MLVISGVHKSLATLHLNAYTHAIAYISEGVQYTRDPKPNIFFVSSFLLKYDIDISDNKVLFQRVNAGRRLKRLN